MASFNKVILIGNLVADPQLKQTPNGVAVTSFRIAVSRRIARQGEPAKADFIDIVCWRQTAEFVTRHFCKGKAILICGSLQNRSWVDNNNVKRYTTEVIADEISFVDKRESLVDNATPSYSSAGSTFEDLPNDSELPF